MEGEMSLEKVNYGLADLLTIPEGKTFDRKSAVNSSCKM